jgi:hypothetical protein
MILDLVARRRLWVLHNFPDEGTDENLQGIVEELGELTHAQLKHNQSIRGFDDEEFENHAQDAIGDLTIYLLGIVYDQGVLPDAISTVAGASEFGDWHRIVKYTWYVVDQPDEPEHVYNLLVALNTYCYSKGWDYDAIVQETWREVSKRDWVKSPGDGLTH